MGKLRKVVRRTPARIVVRWLCAICLSKFKNHTTALKCSLKPVEKKVFEVGDRAEAIEPRTCSERSDRHYTASGTIIKILGPMLPDEEYERKWLGGTKERLNSHVFQYLLSFICPHCEHRIEHIYYSPELRAVKKG